MPDLVMPLIRLASIAAVVLLASACATPGTSAEAPEEPAPPALVESLPPTLDSFEYQGFKYFGDGSDGFSLRYANLRKRRLADVYVYPVAQENSDLEHEKLVMGSTRATMQAIGEAVRQGVYSNFNVVAAATRARGVRTVARVQATYLRENLASYTLVYQTEHDGTLIKIRVTMPDNDMNRRSTEWDRFAERMFREITKDLDKTAA